MRLVLDGQRVQKAARTSDFDEAMQKLADWRAQAKIGHRESSIRLSRIRVNFNALPWLSRSTPFKMPTSLRYEEIRDDYIASGKQVQGRIREKLDMFFKGIRVSAMGGRLTAFREW